MDDLDAGVFRKMGWWLDTLSGIWYVGEAEYKDDLPDVAFGEELPPISSSWEVCAKYLVPFMWEKHICYEIKFNKFHWCFIGFNERPLKYLSAVEIKNDNIALAACEAFMEVEL